MSSVCLRGGGGEEQLVVMWPASSRCGWSRGTEGLGLPLHHRWMCVIHVHERMCRCDQWCDSSVWQHWALGMSWHWQLSILWLLVMRYSAVGHQTKPVDGLFLCIYTLLLLSSWILFTLQVIVIHPFIPTVHLWAALFLWGAIQGSVSCPRTLQHADGKDWDRTIFLLVRGRPLYPLCHSIRKSKS